MNYIDLRSDTVTQPTQEMRDAMYIAPVGDDVYGDDPTMRNLEKLAAEVTGKEAALFTASGTMGNQLAIMTHTVRGDEIIISSEGHVVSHEVGAAAVLSGVMVRTVSCKDDMLTSELIEAAIRPNDIHVPRTSLICLENALSNGKVMPVAQMGACYETAKAHGLAVHLDGARLFNAAIALGTDVKELTKYCDSVMFCLSKGLCAPVGSMLCGDRTFVERARKNRKLLGGGMRQAGVLAACGIVAIEKMSKRLIDDHNNAKKMARLIAEISGASVHEEDVQINMVFFALDRPKELLEKLPSLMFEKGIKIGGPTGNSFRFVTNNDVSSENVEYVVSTLRSFVD